MLKLRSSLHCFLYLLNQFFIVLFLSFALCHNKIIVCCNFYEIDTFDETFAIWLIKLFKPLKLFLNFLLPHAFLLLFSWAFPFFLINFHLFRMDFYLLWWKAQNFILLVVTDGRFCILRNKVPQWLLEKVIVCHLFELHLQVINCFFKIVTFNAIQGLPESTQFTSILELRKQVAYCYCLSQTFIFIKFLMLFLFHFVKNIFFWFLVNPHF